MLENNFIGFSKDKEYLPKDFDEFNSKNRLRQLFLNLSNNILESYCYFSKYEQKTLSNLSLEQAFSYKIKSMLPISFIKNKKIVNTKFKFCINSTKIINNYLYSNNKNEIFISNNKLLPVAKLISVCFIENSLQLLIDKHLLFHEFVLKNIKKLHGDKTVIMLLSLGLKLSADEMLAIRWHMGLWQVNQCDYDNVKNFDNALNMSPIVSILQAADNISTHVVENIQQHID
mgnify:CR=1 FL=1